MSADLLLGRSHLSSNPTRCRALNAANAFALNSTRLDDGIRRIRIRCTHIVLDSEGTIEPALVLIPLLILALTVLQVANGSLSRISASYGSQSKLYSQVLFQDSDTGSQPSLDSLNLSSRKRVTNSSLESSSEAISTSSLEMPGGGFLVTGVESRNLPSLTPLLPGGESFASYPVALSEES